jgi:hypothetical protein
VRRCRAHLAVAGTSGVTPGYTCRRVRHGVILLRTATSVVVAFGCIGGSLAVAAGRTATESVAAMQARDERVLAREIRSAADRRTHTPSEVKTVTSPFGVRALEVLYRAKPGSLSRHGAYLLWVVTGPHGLEKLVVTEFRSRRPYVFGMTAGESTYQLDWTPGNIGFTWLSTGTIGYEHHHSTASNQAILTRTRLEVFYTQALAVIRKAERHAPITKEEELHPGIPCGPRAPGEPACIEPSENA